MLRLIVAVVLAGVALHGWGIASYMVLGLHDASLRPVGDEATEDALVALVQKAGLAEQGWYYWPKMPEDWGDKEAMAGYETRHRSMPVGHLVVSPAGQAVMPGSMMGIGLATNLGIAWLACGLVAMAQLRGFFRRWVFVIALGVLIVLSSEVNNWNWMRFPTDHSIAVAVDRVVGMALAGLVIALLVVPRKAKAAADA